MLNSLFLYEKLKIDVVALWDEASIIEYNTNKNSHIIKLFYNGIAQNY